MSAQTQPAATRREDAPLGVLVGVDGSDQSVSAARWAQREAGLRGEPLTLVTAYSIPAYWGYGADAGGAVLDDSRLREGVQALLEEVAGKLDADGVRPELRVEIGDAAGVLVELSAEASLLVSGARGRGGSGRGRNSWRVRSAGRRSWPRPSDSHAAGPTCAGTPRG